LSDKNLLCLRGILPLNRVAFNYGTTNDFLRASTGYHSKNEYYGYY